MDNDGDRLTRGKAQLFHVGHGGGSHVDLSEGDPGHLHHRHAEGVPARFGIVPDHPFFEQRAKNPGDSALVKTETVTDLADREGRLKLGELSQNRDGAM
jgi:hypothetical protein